jgi:hypothetical protein
MCNRMNEDGAHLFFKCKEVKKVLRELGMESTRESLMEVHSTCFSCLWL